MTISSTYLKYGIEGSRLDPFECLPLDVNFNIHSYLNLHELATCCGVNKKWKKIASHNMSWENAAKLVKPKLPEGMKYKTYFDSRAVTSFDGIIRKLEKFLEGIPIDKKGRFTCQFLYNPKYNILLEVGVGKVSDEESINDLNETCVFLNKISDNGTHGSYVKSFHPADRELRIRIPYLNITYNRIIENFIVKTRNHSLPMYSFDESEMLNHAPFLGKINKVLGIKITKLQRYRSKVLAATMTIAALGTAIIGKLVLDRL